MADFNYRPRNPGTSGGGLSYYAGRSKEKKCYICGKDVDDGTERPVSEDAEAEVFPKAPICHDCLIENYEPDF